MLWGLVVMTAHSVCMEQKPEELQRCYVCGKVACLGPLPGQTSHGRYPARHTWPPLTPDMIAWKYINSNGFRESHNDNV